jgi:hypothetical protein
MTEIAESLFKSPAKTQWRKLLIGVFLSNIAIAMKPTVTVAFSALPLLGLCIKQHRPIFFKLLAATATALIMPAYWYSVHSKQILSVGHGPQIFAIARLDVMTRIREVGPSGFWMLFKREPYQGQLTMFTGWLWIIMAFFLREWIPVALYFLGLFLAIALDGSHIFDHGYYFIGACIFSMLIMASVLSKTKRGWHILATLLLLGGVLYNDRVNIWVWARESHNGAVSYWRMGDQARALIPKDYQLITDDKYYPIKLLYLGRSGMMGAEHALENCNGFRKGNVAMITDASAVSSTLCPGHSTRVYRIRSGLEPQVASWNLILVKE